MRRDGQARARLAAPACALVAAASVLASCIGMIGDAGGNAHRADGGGAAPGSVGTPGDTAADAAAPRCAPRFAEPSRYLRQLSFALRGRPPSADEYDRVAREGEVGAALVDQLLAGDAFLARVGDWHRGLLWSNLGLYTITTRPVYAAEPPAAGATDNRKFSPDGAMLDHIADHPDAVVVQAFDGGPAWRGDERCDSSVEYPPPPAAGATYRATGTDGVTREYPFYDARGVPLPIHDAAHCPNLCVNRERLDLPPEVDSVTLADAQAHRRGAFVPGDFAAMSEPRGDGAPPVHELDPPGASCRAGFVRLVNPCDLRHIPREYAHPEGYLLRRVEGFRWMTPYWSRGVRVKVCAFDAQERETGLASNRPCAGELPYTDGFDPTCGCGPEGAYCTPSPVYGGASRTRARTLAGVQDEPLALIRAIVAADGDYFDALTTREGRVNGPTSLLYRRQVDAQWFNVNQVAWLRMTAPGGEVPAVDFEDDAWHPYTRGPQHAGILTMPAFLGRFPTWRARVAQFRAAFMCRPFTPPPPAPLPPATDACHREQNLARRCGCQGCHAAIEPMGAYWGRWAERSAEYLDPASFPLRDAACVDSCLPGHASGDWRIDAEHCSDRCRRYYVLDPTLAGADAVGSLSATLFRTDEEQRRIAAGPAELVRSALESGELQSCAVRNAWRWVLGQPMTEHEMRVVLPELTAAFGEHGHNFRWLVRAVALSAQARRVD